MKATATERDHVRNVLGDDLYDEARWPDASEATGAQRERDTLLGRLRRSGVCETAGGSKLFTGTLSPGCRACVDGTWSCLYITNWCQADCFYCPQSAVERRTRKDHIPIAEGMAFGDPHTYAAYVTECGFDAVGISGGEPLSSLERVLDFVGAVKELSAGRIYVHVYSNGLLADRRRLTALRDAGVDEIRFDITANDYELAAVQRARAIMPTVTVEIPAVPEDEERLPSVLGDLDAMGVDHLNLHQIHVSPDNARVLIERGYTFLHQPLIVAMESELSALRTMARVLELGLRLPVNYCCPNYKSRYQGRSRTTRAATLVRRPPEEVTAPGYLRVLSLRDEPKRIADLAEQLRGRGYTTDHLRLGDNGTLTLTLTALRDAEPGEAALIASYFKVDLSNDEPAGDDWKQVPGLCQAHLWARRKLAAEAQLATPAVRDAYVEMLATGWDEKRAFLRVQATDASGARELKAAMTDWSRVRQLRAGEVIERGLGVIA